MVSSHLIYQIYLLITFHQNTSNIYRMQCLQYLPSTLVVVYHVYLWFSLGFGELPGFLRATGFCRPVAWQVDVIYTPIVVSINKLTIKRKYINFFVLYIQTIYVHGRLDRFQYFSL